MKYLILLLPALFLLTSCKRDVLVSEKWKFDDGQWLAADVKKMKIQAPDTSQVFRLDLEVEHNEKYAYQNLYVRTVTTYPSGKEVKSISSLELSNPDGSWAGQCSGEGKSCTILLPLQQHFTFPEVGEYTWTIEQYMRTDTVTGINKIEALCSKVIKE